LVVTRPHPASVGNLDFAQASRFEDAADLVKSGDRVFFAEVLEDAVRKHNVKGMRSKRQVPSVTAYKVDFQAQLPRHPLRRQHGTEAGVYSYGGITGFGRSNRPTPPATAKVQQRPVAS
jgi:hypothetical protein